MSYHLRYPDIEEPVKEATLTLIKGKHWRETNDSQQAAMETWLETVSKCYGIETPSVRMDSRVPSQNGGYFPAPEQLILLPYFSVMTLLHEYRHHMQYCVEELVHRFAVDEDQSAAQLDAVEWSTSLFYSVAPRRFERMVNEGRIVYITPEML